MKYIAFFFLISFSSLYAQLPEGFVYVEDIIPDIEVELRYFGTNNFTGTPVEGYTKNTLILSKDAALALKQVQNELKKQGLCLKVFDGYRPQQAVDYFVRWARRLSDTLNKQTYYPNISKSKLFKEGYIASKSGHTRGSTVDLTIIDAKTKKPLDMGSTYDFFGSISGLNSNEISEAQKANRMLLQHVMLKNGFRGYSKEWWHFTLNNEPFKQTYFNFPIN